MTAHPYSILLVEDNDDDVFIFKRAYKQAQLPHALHVATDGQEALDYLEGRGNYADREKFPLPFLVLLDLKLPLKHGLEVLQTIRKQTALDGVCVVVLTSSAEARDILRAHELGAHAFLVKPPAAASLVAAVAAAGSRGNVPEGKRVKIPGDMFEVALTRPRVDLPAS
jgi:CheY-like chemotaxis protein